MTKAVQERLDRVGARAPSVLRGVCWRLARTARLIFKEPFRLADYGDLLYDARGSPQGFAGSAAQTSRWTWSLIIADRQSR